MILNLGEFIKIERDKEKFLNYIFICVSIDNPHCNNELLLMGSMDNNDYYDYKCIKINEREEQVYKVRNVFKYYKLVNIGAKIKGKILIFQI